MTNFKRSGTNLRKKCLRNSTSTLSKIRMKKLSNKIYGKIILNARGIFQLFPEILTNIILLLKKKNQKELYLNYNQEKITSKNYHLTRD